jgi:hypothetical protein
MINDMTHYLRNGTETIVDLETTKDDLHCVIDVRGFSNLLLSSDKQQELIDDFNDLQEIRGTWFERIVRDDTTPRIFATKILKELGKKWGLYYVED